MTTGIRGDHLARLQADLKRQSDRIYELERRIKLKQTNLRKPREHVPAASIYRTTSQGIPDATETTITFNAKRWDTEGIWDGGSGLVCRTEGLYLISASIMWANDSTGQRVLHIKVNSTVIIDDHNQPGDAGYGLVGMSAARSYRLAVGDVVTATALQETTAPFGPQTLNVRALGNFSPELGIAWLGP